MLYTFQRARHNHVNKSWDQDILNEYLYYPLKSVTLAHDSHYCGTYPDALTLPFSMQRVEKEFVGAAARKNPGMWIVPCPVKCRPTYGKTWIYC